MPELDRFERIFQPGWRSAYQHAREGKASVEEIGDKLVKTLAKTLRSSEGVPGLPAMAGIVAAGDGVSILEQFNALDDIVRDRVHRHSIVRDRGHSKVAAEVAKSFLVQQDASAGAPSYEDAVRQLNSGVCVALVGHYFFANARQHLVAEGKIVDHGEAREWQAQIERVIQPPIEKIATQLVQRPDAKGLRAPRSMVRKKSTNSLLEEELLPARARVLG